MMSIEFEPIVDRIDEQFAHVEGLLLEKRELGLEDAGFIGHNQENHFEARVDIRFPTPDDLAWRYIGRRDDPNATEDSPEVNPEIFDTSKSERELAQRLSKIVESAKGHAAKMGVAAAWMIKAVDQSEVINRELGDFGLYYECADDYLRGVGARFDHFELVAEELKTASNIALVSGVYKGEEYEGRLLHVQPLLNIAWILPNDTPWGIKNVVPLDMELDEKGKLNVQTNTTATYSQLWRQPDLF